MRVLHGIWDRAALCLWAEDSELPARGEGPRPRPHPFACSHAELADSIDLVTDAARKADNGEVMLRLPAIGDVPLTSPELIRPDTVLSRRRQALRSFLVPVLRFAPADAPGLLAALDGAAELTLGASIPYLAAVARFAASLAANGRVLPVLVREDGGGYAARWRPVLTGADAQHAGDLVAAMPPACRAGQSEDQAEVFAATLAALADCAARVRLGTTALLPARRGRAPARIAMAERFVLALTTTDAAVPVVTADDQAEAAALAADLSAWLDGARMPAGLTRACFRLAEPADEAGEGGWQVGFALQSVAEPSLIVPAADIWAGDSSSLGGDAVEQLLAGLGGAARLFPELMDALREPAPAGLVLDTAGAFGFLKQTGPLLAGAGFGVLLPDWVRKARLGVKLTTRSRTRSTGSDGTAVTPARLGLRDLVSFRYDLAVGDQALGAEELAELARLKVPLVRLRGQWVELDQRHLAAALKFLERHPPGTMSGSEALAAGLGLANGEPGGDEVEAVPLAAVDSDGWLGDLLSGHAETRLSPVPAPPGFTGTLRPYQERGLAWLAFLGELGLGGVLADDMGLGKTVQLLSLVAATGSVAAPSAQTGPTLLVCPMSLVGNWEREAARFTPDLRVHVHHGADRLDGDELSAALAGADLVITTYGVATRDRAALAEVRWARVVCDEAQNIKNHATRQAQAVRALPAGSKIALTGTPVENRLSELWSIMDFTNPGLLGSASKFRTRYAIPVERHDDADAATALRRLTRPFMLRRLKTDKSIISDLPDKQEMKVWCNLTAEQASLYQATVDDMMSRIEQAEAGEMAEIARRGLVLATMAKLKQVCNHPAHLLGDGSRLPGRSGKLARLEELCDEIAAAGDKALCFTQYAEFGRLLRPYLAARIGCPVFFLHGGTTKRQRDEMVAEFTALDEPALFLLSLKAGGTGLNLTAASHVIHVDRWWNPAVEDQATDRAFRIGQQRNVQVRKFVCVGTLEERIDAMIEEKKALAGKIVGTGESWLTELSAADLREVLRLSPEAVSE
jgi:SNF2-related domain/SNF2 Helicase protein/Helicase conserved C-terminal domain